ncbi:hypothetical protein D9757_007267 [Collybiopsis confluens]|uniref:Fork-head domain-containing protein n=1 Tax=Collybiopsis confluens TaxID=2823264 RepID=A0A8H5HGJ5_9AGAR|nr:hypothetical protein D9757_007267 [Collybiopsis confluens]
MLNTIDHLTRRSPYSFLQITVRWKEAPTDKKGLSLVWRNTRPCPHMQISTRQARYPDSGPALRAAYNIPPGVPANLDALEDPPAGTRPAVTLSALIQLAIYGSPRGMLTTYEICSVIEGIASTHAVFESVFVQIPRSLSDPGMGYFWALSTLPEEEGEVEGVLSHYASVLLNMVIPQQAPLYKKNMPAARNSQHSSHMLPSARTRNHPAFSDIEALTDSDCFPDAGPVLRSAFCIPPGVPINLNAIKDPPPGIKPVVPLEELVQLAIYGSSRGKLTLQEIYSAIEDRFEYFRTNKADKWRSSIRHMLSLKSIFVKTQRPRTCPGRGDFWQLNVAVTFKYKRPRKRNTTSHSAKRRKFMRAPSLADQRSDSSQVDNIPPHHSLTRNAALDPCYVDEAQHYRLPYTTPLPFEEMKPALNGMSFSTPTPYHSSSRNLQPNVVYPTQEMGSFFDFSSAGQAPPRDHLPASSALFNPSRDVWWAPSSSSKSASPEPPVRLSKPMSSYRPIITNMNFSSHPHTPSF